VTESAGVRMIDPADGLVAVSSARFGLFRGCLPADHYDLVGRLADRGPDPVTGFDAARFYAALALDLAERGL
jgi:triacylglycerol lipase